ncbi:MAG: hypothetical protein P1Q69_14830 [Candidatus Thorarchaeota archaeon]|nr:hypothetical protein [Candidatus Thorarchaeota archaeon]
MKQTIVREGDARAKEEASKWKNEEKAAQIIKLFESGVHLSGIRDSVFPNWTLDMTKDEKYYRKTTIDYIVLKVLECEDWDEYSRKQTKLRNLRKKKKMKQ